MAHPVERFEDKVSAESTNLDKKYYKLGEWSLLVFIVVAFVLFLCYKWNYPWWEFDYPIDAERWGQFGDFFGGVIGTIITFASIVFVYMAFKEQRLANVEAHEANKEMIAQAEQNKDMTNNQLYSTLVQQFDSNFKTLLDLYNESIQGYKSPSGSIPQGKASMSNYVSSYISSTTFENKGGYTKRTTAAANVFNDFFAKNMTVVNAHMRLLFQIFNLLDSNAIDEEDKVIYAKMLRSQLTDEELILIRYNCMTKRGRKMQMPVFHYNILKHLPLLYLFEFKKYRKGLSSTHINLLNDEFISWRKDICNLFRRQSEGVKTASTRTYNNRYCIDMTVSADNKSYTFTLYRTPKVHGGVYDQMVKVFDNYYDDISMLEALLQDFHTEVFRHSHFRYFNRDSSFRITHQSKQIGADVRITIKVHQDSPLIVSYFQIENPSRG